MLDWFHHILLTLFQKNSAYWFKLSRDGVPSSSDAARKSFASVSLGQPLGVNLRRGVPTYSRAHNRSRWDNEANNAEEKRKSRTSQPLPKPNEAHVRQVAEKIKEPPKKPILRRIIDEKVVINSSSSDELEVRVRNWWTLWFENINKS